MTTNVDEPREWLTRAILDVSDEHEALWTLQTGERARVAHIFARLREIVPRHWDVDCEWNKEGQAASKKMLMIGRAATYGTPDLIIHQRGESGPVNNLLIVEFKLDANELSATSKDYEKVSYWMQSIGYQFGALVSLGRATPNLKLMWRDSVTATPRVEIL